MATGSVWIRGNDPNGWVPLDLGLHLAEGIPDFVRSMSSAVADQIGKVLLMDAKTDAGFLSSIELADYLPEGVTIDANPEAKA